MQKQLSVWRQKAMEKNAMNILDDYGVKDLFFAQAIAVTLQKMLDKTEIETELVQSKTARQL